MRKKVLGVLIGSLVLTGCNGIGISEKSLVCTSSSKDNGINQELKYVMKFNNDGTVLKNVEATISWSGSEIITESMLEEAFCSTNEILKDNCDVKKLKNNSYAVVMSKNISDSDDTVLGDFYIDDNNTYEKAKENFEKNEWNSVNWTCK